MGYIGVLLWLYVRDEGFYLEIFTKCDGAVTKLRTRLVTLTSKFITYCILELHVTDFLLYVVVDTSTVQSQKLPVH